MQPHHASDPTLVLTQKKNGGYARKPLKPLGALKKIRVEKRENSGLVTELVLVGKKNVINFQSFAPVKGSNSAHRFFYGFFL